MRLPSKGMAFGSIMPVRRRSAITLAFTRLRCARDLYTIQEKATVSPGLSFTLRGKDVSFPLFTSSAIHSRYSSAPCSRQILPAFCAICRYTCRFFLGPGGHPGGHPASPGDGHLKLLHP